MNPDNLPIYIRRFNEKVRAMNQSQSKVLTLNQLEAQSLHAEIYELMATISYLAKPTVEENIEAKLDGGGF
ncbi:MAG TPA: hypothetical protein VFM18_18770 [Methanosarcina sp.]|nr:hypothetical protein [Methanosarcina sp.]